MLILITLLTCSFLILITTAVMVVIRRHRNTVQNVGYVVNPNGTATLVSPTHTTPYAIPVTRYPPSVCQPVIITSAVQSTNSYNQPPSYQYQTTTRNISQAAPGWPMQMQGVQLVITSEQANNSSMQPPVYSETVSYGEITVLPGGKEKPVQHQVHEGAVETISTI